MLHHIDPRKERKMKSLRSLTIITVLAIAFLFATTTVTYADDENGEPEKVTVVNGEQSPVPVTLVNGPDTGVTAIEPVDFRLREGDAYTVPSDKRLRINFLSIRAIKKALAPSAGENDVSATISIGGNLVSKEVAFLAPFAGPIPTQSGAMIKNAYYFVGNVSIYAEGFEVVSMTISTPESGADLDSWEALIHGVLEPIAP